VTVIAPDATSSLEELAEQGAITLVKRQYQRGDLADAFLAIAATDDGATNGEIFAEAEDCRVLLNAVDDIERRTGVRNDGISFSTLTFVSKTMAALAVLVFGIFIVLAGYEAGVTVTPEMQWTVFVSLTLVPAASCLVSAIPFVFYRLGR
jgi:uncharacterized membrane protein